MDFTSILQIGLGRYMQVLVSAMNQELETLIKHMNIQSDAIIVNQCDENTYEELEENGKRIQFYSFKERGVGLSRNTALMRATGEIALFADEDIRYVEGYEKLVEREFDIHPEADILLFQFNICPERKTYDTTRFKRIRWHNCGRYPLVSMAIRTKRVIERNITFSLLFGGGAIYSNGEDSLFLQECIRKGLKVYATPVLLGEELESESTWFHGYTEKFFYDRGVLYKHLYRRYAPIFAFRFLWKHKNKMCQTISMKQAYVLMREGIRSALVS